MAPFIRIPTHRYDDPLSRIWTACAERVGFHIVRTADAYASTDGRGALLIGEDRLLDPDDSLAQMIFHELCHALVEGEEGERLEDWGLDNTSGRHTWREHACLRLQAYLADAHGLRNFFAPTTDFRVSFWSGLPADPFAAQAEKGGRRERSSVAARLAARRASQSRWRPHLQGALQATATIAAITPRDIGADHIADTLPSLWTSPMVSRTLHPAAHAAIVDYHQGNGCKDCAWGYGFRGSLRCRHAPDRRLDQAAPACARWEPAEELDCLSCGACCREAYDSVEVLAREKVIERHPDMVIRRDTHIKLRREGDRCAALVGGDSAIEPFGCRIYPDRPRTCRDFTKASANCLEARRRVGLSL